MLVEKTSAQDSGNIAQPSKQIRRYPATDTTAKVYLALLAATEAYYYLEHGKYVACDSGADCCKKLNFTVTNETLDWNFRADLTDDGFCAQAIDNQGVPQWHITDKEKKLLAGGCP